VETLDLEAVVGEYDFERLEKFEIVIEQIEERLEEARSGQENPVFKYYIPEEILDDTIDYCEAQFECVIRVLKVKRGIASVKIAIATEV